jgi:hypothetical protein
MIILFFTNSMTNIYLVVSFLLIITIIFTKVFKKKEEKGSSELPDFSKLFGE